MHRLSTRKAFTIVELIIVIAVIGVLAAILIPTFSGIIRKANIAKDVSLCKNMTTTLAIESENEGEITTPQSIAEVLISLCRNDYDMSQLKTQTEGTAIYWIRTINKIVLVDKSEADEAAPDVYSADWNVLWPKEIAALERTELDNLFNHNTGSGDVPDYFELDHRIKADMSWITNNAAAINNATEEAPAEITVDTADQLAALSLMLATDTANNTPTRSEPYVMHTNFDNCIITLTSDLYIGNNAWSPIGAPVRSGEIDMDGTGNIVTFTHNGNKEYRFAGTFDGAGHTIYGLSMNSNYEPDSVYSNRFGYSAYTFGLFGSTFDATIRNLNMSDVSIDNRGMTDEEGNEICGDSVAAIVGLSSGELTIENCTVSGEIYSWDCVSGIVARHYASAPLTIKNTTNNANITAYGIDGSNMGKKAGGILGYAGNDFRDVVFENVTNNGNIVGGTAGGIASYMSSSHTANSGTINFKNVINNGNISNHYNNEYFSAGGAGGIFGSIFNANSKTDVSVWENVINNGEVSSKNGCAAFGIMGTLKTPLLLKGRIENNANLSNEGSTQGVYGMFENIDTNLTIDTGATLKQKGDVFSGSVSSNPTCGIAGSISKAGTVTVNGKIEQSGDVHNTLGMAYGMFANVSGTTVIFNSGSIVKMSGDVRGVTRASGVFGIVTSIAPSVQCTVTVARGATIDVSGNIYCKAADMAGTSTDSMAFASGLISTVWGIASQNKTTTPYTFNDAKAVLSIEGTVRVTSPSITAVSDGAVSTTSITKSSVAAGLIAYSYYSDISFVAGSAVTVSGSNISATASNSAYKGRVISAGIIGHIYGTRLADAAAAPINYYVFKLVMAGTATVQNCTLSIAYTSSTVNNCGVAAGIGVPGAAAYLDTTGFTVNDVNNAFSRP